MPHSPLRLFFVYGTLRKGEVRDINRMQPAPRWVGQAWVTGALYHLGAYPGMALGAAGRVVGEVYEISAELERQLDEIEEVWPQQTGEYIKREATVLLEGPAGPDACVQGSPATSNPRALVCLLYEIAPDRVANAPVIACGDWVRRSVVAGCSPDDA